MKSLRALQSMLLTSTLVGGCMGQWYTDPYSEMLTHLAEEVRAVAITPVAVGEGLPLPDEATLAFVDTLIESQLATTDLVIIHTGEYLALWDSITASYGELVDSLTGERNEEHFEKARTALFDELDRRFGTTGLLFADISLVLAEYSQGTAQWDGTTEEIQGFGSRLLEAIALSATRYAQPTSGTINATSIQIYIESRDHDEYRNWGGIEVIQDVVTRNTVAPEQMFQNRERLEHAIRVALGPLVEQRQPELGVPRDTIR